MIITHNGNIIMSDGFILNKVSSTPTPPSFTNTLSTTFDGVDDYVEIGSPTSIQSLTSAITISAWIKAPRTFATNYYTLASKGEYAGVGSQWTIQINTANARNTAGGRFYVFPQANAITDNQDLVFPTPVDDNQWHHMMFVNDGTDLKVYIDGVLDATGAGKGRTLYEGNRSLRLGRLTASTTQKLIGNLDEVAIFGTALQLSDAQTIYGSGVPTSLSTYASLISWWRMGDGGTYPTITDNKGSNNGTMTNMSSANFVTDVPFNYKSILFDGVDDYVDCGDFSAYDNGDLSFSLWVYKTTSGLEYVFSNSGSGTIAGFDVVIWDKHIKIDRRTRTKQSSSAYKLLGLNYNTWHNIIGTYNDTTDELKVYFDGTFKATYSASSDVNSASIPLSIGSYAGTSNFFQGNIDEVSVFTSEISASDVTAIYNSGVPTSLASLSPLSWWRFEGTGTTAIDSGSGGNNGTLINGVTRSTDVPT